jgi:magnesium transporter
VAISLLNGLTLSILVAAVAWLWFRDPILSGVIGSALAANLLLASLAGVLLPLALDRLNVDPALAGSMAVMTVTDVMGFFIFLGLGTVLLL